MEINLCSIYVDIDSKVNLIAPFPIVGCWLSKEYENQFKEILEIHSHKKPIQVVKKINRLKIPKNKYFTYTYLVQAFYIDKYGLEKAVIDGINHIEWVISNKVSNPFFIIQTSRLLNLEGLTSAYLPSSFNHVQLEVARLFTQSIRNYYLGRYLTQYPKLWVNQHKGRVNKAHLYYLSFLKLLPPFYIKYLTIDAYIASLSKRNRDFTLAPWFKLFVENYIQEKDL